MLHPGILLELARVRVTLAVTLSVAAGHLLFARGPTPALLPAALGVFLVAAGSAALNQVQEARLDRLMLRTRGRPIPSGRIDPAWAAFLALALIGSGFYTLARIEHHTLAILALAGLAVLWYNGVYTYLKRVTAFAAVPGALVGAIPPAIGWSAAGGVLADPANLELCFFLYLWQIPHFWLLQVLYGDDYARAGLPSLRRLFAEGQLRRIHLAWTAGLAAAALALALRGGLRLPWSALLLAASLGLVGHALGVLRRGREGWPGRSFLLVNLFGLAVLAALAGAALTRTP